MEKENVRVSISSGTVVRVLLIIILFLLAYIIRDVLLVMVASVVVASAIEPQIRWLTRKKIHRVASVLIVYAVLGLLVTAVFYFLLLPLLNETSVFFASLPQYIDTLDAWNPLKTNPFLSSQPVFQGISSGFSVKEIAATINQTFSTFSEGFFITVSAIFGGALSFILIIVISFYLAVQEDGVASFLSLITPLSHRKYVLGLWSRSESKIGLWLQGQLMLGVIVAVLVYLGLLLLGIKHALLLAVLAGAFELIPLFGPILAAIPGVVIAFVGGGFGLSFIVAGMYLIVQQFESNLIYPLVVKKVVGVPPIVSIVALVIGAKLAGFLGFLLAVPIAAILMVFLNDLQRDRIEEEKVKVGK